MFVKDLLNDFYNVIHGKVSMIVLLLVDVWLFRDG